MARFTRSLMATVLVAFSFSLVGCAGGSPTAPSSVSATPTTPEAPVAPPVTPSPAPAPAPAIPTLGVGRTYAMAAVGPNGTIRWADGEHSVSASGFPSGALEAAIARINPLLGAVVLVVSAGPAEITFTNDPSSGGITSCGSEGVKPVGADGVIRSGGGVLHLGQNGCPMALAVDYLTHALGHAMGLGMHTNGLIQGLDVMSNPWGTDHGRISPELQDAWSWIYRVPLRTRPQ